MRPIVAVTLAVVGTLALAGFLVGVAQSYTIDPYAPTTEFVRSHVNEVRSAAQNLSIALDQVDQNYSLIADEGKALSALTAVLRVDLTNYTYTNNASQYFARILTTYEGAGNAFLQLNASKGASFNSRLFATGIPLKMQGDAQLEELIRSLNG
jgi:hypothetical protein